MGDEDLNVKLLELAEKRVGTKAVMKTGYGKDCFVLVDMLLRKIGAATAADGLVEVTPTADYDWGDGILLENIKPGDILQFDKHLIHIETKTFDENDKLTKTDEQWLKRGHHSAIVAEVNKDGSYAVIEQNVHPNPDIVHRNIIWLEDKTQRVTVGKGEQKIKIKVTGSVGAYRPIPKPLKGASLISPGNAAPGIGWRALAGIVPSQGGGKRPPGPFGRDVSIGSESDELA